VRVYVCIVKLLLKYSSIALHASVTATRSLVEFLAYLTLIVFL